VSNLIILGFDRSRCAIVEVRFGVIRDRAVSLETHPMTAVALKRTSAERRPGSSSK